MQAMEAAPASERLAARAVVLDEIIRMRGRRQIPH